MVKLENLLADGWITTQRTPTAGSLKNDQFGMTTSFNSDAMSVQQTQAVSFDLFLDQTCKIFDTLWPMFEIKRINQPSVRIILQKGFEDNELDSASRYMLSLKLCAPNAGLRNLMGGKETALDFVFVTSEDLVWGEVNAYQRRRVECKVIRQERQPPFNERLLRPNSATRATSNKMQ